MQLARRRALAYGAAALAAAGAGIWASTRLLSGTDATTDSASALDGASFLDLAGKTRRISEWRGKVVVVNFWATWCAPCREEIPMLMEVRRDQAEKGLEVVGIAIDNAAKVSEYARNVSISYPVLISGGSGLELIRKLGNSSGGLPYTVFLDRLGAPVRSKLGALQRPELEALLTGLLS